MTLAREKIFLCPICGNIEIGKVPDKCPICCSIRETVPGNYLITFYPYPGAGIHSFRHLPPGLFYAGAATS